MEIVVWIVIIVCALLVCCMGGSDRQAYRTAKGAIEPAHPAQPGHGSIMAVEMATKSVDLALKQGGQPARPSWPKPT